MGNSIKYTTGTENNSLSKGNFRIGTGDVGKGPTSSTGFYKATAPPSGGYRIYLYNTNVSGDIAYHTAANDAELISFTNNIAGQSFTSTTQCFTYYATQTDKICFNREYESISTSGLVFNMDAGFTPSYPTSGTTWYDIKNANNKTLINSPSYVNEFGGELSFDGIDDYVSGTAISELVYTNDYTLIIWLNNTNNGYVMANNTGGGLFGVNIFSGTLSGFFYNGSFYTTVGRSVRYGAWEQIVLVNQSQQLTLYVSMNKTTTGGGPLNPGGTGLTIGRRNRTSEIYFNGKISQVQVYNRAMTESEILYNYQTMLPRFVGENFVTSGLVFYLDAGYNTSYPTSGTTWYDVSGYNNNGTLTNGPTYSGGSIVFDGSDDFVDVTCQSTNLFSNLTSFTVSFWLKETSFDGNGSVLISSAGNNNNNLFLQIQSGSVYIGVIGSNSNFLTLSISLSNLTLNKISNMVWVKDGNTSYFYLNSNKYTFPGVSNFNFIGSNTKFNIGKYTSSSFEFTGNMYLTQIYNRALSASEILQNYNAQKGRFGL